VYFNCWKYKVEKNKLGLTIHLEKEQLMFRWKLKVTFFSNNFLWKMWQLLWNMETLEFLVRFDIVLYVNLGRKQNFFFLGLGRKHTWSSTLTYKNSYAQGKFRTRTQIITKYIQSNNLDISTWVKLFGHYSPFLIHIFIWF
jgi:hypothetical protein